MHRVAEGSRAGLSPHLLAAQPLALVHGVNVAALCNSVAIAESASLNKDVEHGNKAVRAVLSK